MRSFDHLQARTVQEAVALLSQFRGKARLIAGGTDLLGALKDEILPEYPQALIDIKTLPGMEAIRLEAGVLTIGALARLRDISASPLVRERFGVLAEAALSVASPQIRNAATLGGNLCQDVRCWYYRYPKHLGGPIPCRRKGNAPCPAPAGDNRYHAVLGGRQCFAVCPSDLAVALAALEARLLVTGPGGTRDMAIPDLYQPLGLGLSSEEILMEIRIPAPPRQMRQHWFKFTLRRPLDFAIVSLAAMIEEEQGVCQDVRLCLGALSPAPFRPREAEASLRGRALDETAAAAASDLALAGARSLSGNAYKLTIAGTLIKRSLLQGSS